jgi:very-short-patch-repair endonuclease
MTIIGDALRAREPFDRRIAALASMQLGAFSLEQAVQLGATMGMVDRRVALRRWVSVSRGVYTLFGCPATWRQRLFAACLAYGPSAAAADGAAAALWRLLDFDEGPLHLIVPRSRRRELDGVSVRRCRLSPRDITTIDSIPVTTPARTLVGLAARYGERRVEIALDDALNRGLVSLSSFAMRLNATDSRGRREVAVLRRLVAERDPSMAPPASASETVFMRLLRRWKVAGAATQYPIFDGPRLVAVVDVAFPSEHVAVELEGGRFHALRPRWERDLARFNRLVVLGWQPLRFTAVRLRGDPAGVERELKAALEIGRRLSRLE